MEVHSHWRQERGRQPLPGEVPMGQQELELDVGEKLVSHPVLVDAGGLRGLQKGRVDTEGGRASERNGPLLQKNPALKSSTHPVVEEEGRPAASW